MFCHLPFYITEDVNEKTCIIFTKGSTYLITPLREMLIGESETSGPYSSAIRTSYSLLTLAILIQSVELNETSNYRALPNFLRFLKLKLAGMMAYAYHSP